MCNTLICCAFSVPFDHHVDLWYWQGIELLLIINQVVRSVSYALRTSEGNKPLEID